MKENITFSYGKHQVTLESGEIARQADGAVMVNMEGTVVLVTAVAKKTVAEGQDFFPLTVDYQEKTYAAGRNGIPAEPLFRSTSVAKAVPAKTKHWSRA